MPRVVPLIVSPAGLFAVIDHKLTTILYFIPLILASTPSKKSQKGVVKNEKTLCPMDTRFFHGGEGGIRTLDTLLGYTRFPIVRARPDYATSPRPPNLPLCNSSYVIIINAIGKVKVFFKFSPQNSRQVNPAAAVKKRKESPDKLLADAVKKGIMKYQEPNIRKSANPAV